MYIAEAYGSTEFCRRIGYIRGGGMRGIQFMEVMLNERLRSVSDELLDQPVELLLPPEVRDGHIANAVKLIDRRKTA